MGSSGPGKVPVHTDLESRDSQEVLVAGIARDGQHGEGDGG